MCLQRIPMPKTQGKSWKLLHLREKYYSYKAVGVRLSLGSLAWKKPVNPTN